MHDLDGQKEEVIDTSVRASSVFLANYAIKAYATVQKAVYSVCSLHNIECHIFIDKEEFEHSEALKSYVNFVLTDPPYNIRFA